MIPTLAVPGSHSHPQPLYHDNVGVAHRDCQGKPADYGLFVYWISLGGTLGIEAYPLNHFKPQVY